MSSHDFLHVEVLSRVLLYGLPASIIHYLIDSFAGINLELQDLKLLFRLFLY